MSLCASRQPEELRDDTNDIGPPKTVIPAQAGTHLLPRRERQPAVYILASKHNGTLYVGVTSNLNQRVWQHKTGEFGGFTKKHKVHRLVHYEYFNTMDAAIARERAMKKWNRAWKIRLIEENNPEWLDLYDELR